MAWNPHPKVADCREIARKWSTEQVIVIGIDGDGQCSMATYGETKTLCNCAKALGHVAFNAIERHIESLCANTGDDPPNIPKDEQRP